MTDSESSIDRALESMENKDRRKARHDEREKEDRRRDKKTNKEKENKEDSAKYAKGEKEISRNKLDGNYCKTKRDHSHLFDIDSNFEEVSASKEEKRQENHREKRNLLEISASRKEHREEVRSERRKESESSKDKRRKESESSESSKDKRRKESESSKDKRRKESESSESSKDKRRKESESSKDKGDSEERRKEKKEKTLIKKEIIVPVATDKDENISKDELEYKTPRDDYGNGKSKVDKESSQGSKENEKHESHKGFAKIPTEHSKKEIRKENDNSKDKGYERRKEDNQERRKEKKEKTVIKKEIDDPEYAVTEKNSKVELEYVYGVKIETNHRGTIRSQESKDYLRNEKQKDGSEKSNRPLKERDDKKYESHKRIAEVPSEKDKTASKDKHENRGDYKNKTENREKGKRDEESHKGRIENETNHTDGSLLHTSRSDSSANNSLRRTKSPEPSNSKNVQDRLREMADGDGDEPIEKPDRGIWLRLQMEAKKRAEGEDYENREPTEEEIIRQEKLPVIRDVNEYKDPVCVWKPIEKSDPKIQSWRKDLLPEEVPEEKPKDWRPPTPPIVDKSLLQFLNFFQKEKEDPPAIDGIVSGKDRMKLAGELSDNEELLMMSNFCIIKTTPAGIKQSKQDREREEEEDAMYNSRFSRGGGRGGRGRGGRGAGRGRGGFGRGGRGGFGGGRPSFGGGRPNANTEPMGSSKRPRSPSYSPTRSKRIRMEDKYQERDGRENRRDGMSRYDRENDEMSRYGRENDEMSRYGRENGRQERDDRHSRYGGRDGMSSYSRDSGREERPRYREDRSRDDRGDGRWETSSSRSRRDDHREFRESRGERYEKEYRGQMEAPRRTSIGEKEMEAPRRSSIGEKRPLSPGRSRNEDSGYRKSRTDEHRTSSRHGERSKEYEPRLHREDHGTRDHKGPTKDHNSSFGEMHRGTRNGRDDDKFKQERWQSPSDSNSSFGEKPSTSNSKVPTYKEYKANKAKKASEAGENKK